MASDVDSITVQGMSIPKRDWEEGWKLFQIGGEDPKGEVGVGPNGETDPDTAEFTPDGTYSFFMDVMLPIEDTGYKITAGKGSSHTAGASENLTITCDGALEDLVSISVDGTVIDSDNYTLESGSTILTLKAAFLNSLSAGSHTVTFTYKDGQSASADFTIAEQTQVTASQQTTTTSNAPTSPKTGDTTPIVQERNTTPIAVCIILVLIAGVSFLTIGFKRTRR